MGIGSIIEYGSFKFPVLYIHEVIKLHEADIIKVCTEMDLETSSTERDAPPLRFNYSNRMWIFHQRPQYNYELKLFRREDFWE